MSKQLSKAWPALFGLLTITTACPSYGQDQQQVRPLPYKYAYASYALTEIDTGGIEVGVLFSVTPRIHVFGAYQDWELGENTDRSILQFGAGYVWSLSSNLDMAARASIASSELDLPRRREIDDDGLILSGILRGWISDDVELSGELLLDDSLGDIDTVVEFGGQYYLNNSQFSVGGRIRVDEDETTLFLGGRFYFRD